MLVKSLLEKFLYHLDKERGLSPRTQDNYRAPLERVLDRIDQGLRRRRGLIQVGLELHHLTRPRLQREINRSSDGNVRNVAAAIRAFFRFLVLRGHAKEDIGQRLLARKVTHRRYQYYTEVQARRLLAAAPKAPRSRQQEVQAVRDTALVSVLYESGLRSSEICGLNLDSVSWNSPRRGCAALRVFGKGRKERDVVLRYSVGPVKQWLACRDELANPGEKALFVMVRRGGRMNRALVWSAVHKRGLVAGVQGAHPHRFRQSFATHLLWRGADLFVVQDLMGHERLETTRLYAATDPRKVLTKGIDCHPLNCRTRRSKSATSTRRDKHATERRGKHATHERRDTNAPRKGAIHERRDTNAPRARRGKGLTRAAS